MKQLIWECSELAIISSTLLCCLTFALDGNAALVGLAGVVTDECALTDDVVVPGVSNMEVCSARD